MSKSPSDFPNSKIDPKAIRWLGLEGRLLSGSKSQYREEYPNNAVVFNANVFAGNQKIWYGDLDLSKQSDIRGLEELSKDLRKTIYVLTEMDARFGKERRTLSEVEKVALWRTGDGEITCLELQRRRERV